jgi:hypothetical protein
MDTDRKTLKANSCLPILGLRVHKRIEPSIQERYMICLNNIEANSPTLRRCQENLAVGVFLEAIQLHLALLRAYIAIKPDFPKFRTTSKDVLAHNQNGENNRNEYTHHLPGAVDAEIIDEDTFEQVQPPFEET